MTRLTALLLSSIVFFARVVIAEGPNLCVAPYFLASKNFKANKHKEVFEPVGERLLAFLWNTPGTKLSNLAKAFADPQVTGIEMILINENCAKPQYGPKGRCGSYELLAGMNTNTFRKLVRAHDPALKTKIEGYASKACSFVDAHLPVGKTKLINPLLETLCSRAEWQVVAGWIQPFCPDWEFVWNPIGGKPGIPPLPATIAEGHGPSPKFADNRCIANPDGSAIEDWESYFRKYANCRAVCAWTANDNCIYSGQTSFIDPRQRACDDTSMWSAAAAGMVASLVPQPPIEPWTSQDDAALVGCVSIHDSEDGEGGFIWKQSHVSRYHGAILFPGRYGKFRSVEVRKGIKRIGKVVWAPGGGFPDKAAHGLKRPIWRTNRDLRFYPYNVVVRGKLSKPVIDRKTHKIIHKAGLHCWQIFNPKIRND